MPDSEKVIKGLECHVEDNCVECPYRDGWRTCPFGETLLTDALALLKEQEAIWIEYHECLKYDEAYSTDHIVCSACKHVFSVMDNCTEEFNYCPHCGAKMN